MIRLAGTADINRIMIIVKRVIKDMHDEGSDQWNHQYPGSRDFLNDIAREELYVYEDDNVPGVLRGVVCINQEEPAEYQGADWLRPGPATVIHRLAVDPDFKRHGIATRLCIMAENMAVRNGTFYLRSDTYSLNPAMNTLFLRLGYHHSGIIRFPERIQTFNCYEKIIHDRGEK